MLGKSGLVCGDSSRQNKSSGLLGQLRHVQKEPPLAPGGPVGPRCRGTYPPALRPSAPFFFQEMERKQEEQNKIQAEIRRVNDENRRRKEEQREQERIEDERVLEYQRQKMVPGPRVRHGLGWRRWSRGSCHGVPCRAGARGRAGG